MKFTDDSFIIIKGRVDSYLEDYDILIVSLLNKKKSLIPITLSGTRLKENIKLLSYGDIVGVKAHFENGNGKYCDIQADNITLMQRPNSGKEVS
jgi:hypothetical protein